jgi:GpV Apex motif
MSQSTNPPVLSSHVASDAASEVGRMNYIIQAALSGLRTAMPVKVVKVTNTGGLSAVGQVDVQPLVSAVDGSGKAWPHGIIHNVPYMRIQGGSNGIILDPVVGDIGIASVCDRDISTVKNAKKVSAPGSNRKNDMSDMVYLMTIIGAAPTQYVQFSSAGITIHSPTKVIVNAPEIDSVGVWNHTGDMNVTGNLGATGTGSFGGNVTGNGVGLNTHHHTGVQPGSGNSGGPVG